ncbi:hypothetical protein KIN20_003104 [Parelaphostrongylus tenuis]|uniref:ABC transmembrane type-1 domain-containing protein n=1 Tax=Parelaphostrongylus tenuis TaxID=148309 RepID=A0AAD5MPG0_PARTN|nr:hypothetical protein KIN20_003104 [Parelaphostrongylus tenuis]
MGRLIRYFRYDVPLTPMEAYTAAGGIAFTAACLPMIDHSYYYGLQKIALQVKVAISGMLVNKANDDMNEDVFRKEIAIRTDKRLNVMNEILNGIRTIKMYTWEDAFSEVVNNLRR